MQRLWIWFGIALFFLLKPLLFFYLRLNERTRVIIFSKNQVLLVKPWLGNGRWDLPGGGLHHSEQPIFGAIRETYEETGIKLGQDTLLPLGKLKGKGFFPYRLHCFSVDFESRMPKVKKQYVEIIDIAWVSVNRLDSYNLDPLALRCLDLWKSR